LFRVLANQLMAAQLINIHILVSYNRASFERHRNFHRFMADRASAVCGTGSQQAMQTRMLQRRQEIALAMRLG
jgi:hypothetical protein